MEEKNETLRQYLDRIHIEPGDDSGFVLQEVGTGTEMQVSRRYLESEPFKDMLDKEIVDYIYPFYDIFGTKTVKFYVK